MADISDGLIVFTDLDGSLLDHDTYRWDAARPWLARLQADDVPVILTSSKTASEVRPLQHRLGLSAYPFIAENGALVALPTAWRQHPDFPQKTFHFDYRQICQALTELRRQHGFEFIGFADMDEADVARVTGLSRQEAALARRREASEPLLWQGDERSLQLFRQELARHQLALTQGGRFFHVMGREVSKGAAVSWLRAQYPRPLPALGLGDGPNDASMLAATDYAVIIQGKASDRLFLPSDYSGEYYRTAAAGPAGWSEGLSHFLN